ANVPSAAKGRAALRPCVAGQCGPGQEIAMRNDTLFSTTLAVLSALLACGGLASARSTQVAVAGRIVRAGAPVPAGARATLRLDDDAAGIHLSLPVSCAEACTFFGHVPPGSYRASVGAPFALPGHCALLA